VQHRAEGDRQIVQEVSGEADSGGIAIETERA
jgi:hypothetical protein